jgi:pteridine reductase
MTTIRTALVTGGGKRVGRAIVERLAAAGFKVAFSYNRSTPSDLTWAKALQALTIQADLTDLPAGAETLSTAIRNSFGRLDVLVNNASIYEPSSLGQTTLEQLRRFNSIHVEAPLLLVQRLAPLLKVSRGHIVNMVDLLAERPWPQYLAYSTSKAALLNLTLGLARELAPDVTVNGIAPGVVEWPPNYSEAEKEKYLKRVPLARAGTPADVAETIHFLVTGGSYITGQIIHLDGGRSIA